MSLHHTPPSNPALDVTLPPENVIDPRFNHVISGLGYVYLGLVIEVILFVLSICYGFYAGRTFKTGVIIVPPALIVSISLILILGGLLVSLVGKYYCIDVPEKLHARAYVIASAALSTFVVIITLLSQLGSRLPIDRMMILRLAQFSQPAGILSHIFFLVFVRKVALFLNEPGYANRALILMGFSGLTVVFLLLLNGYPRFLVSIMLMFGWIALILGLLIYLLLAGLYGDLLYYLRKRLISFTRGQTLD